MQRPPEKELMRLMKFGTARNIRDLINSNPSMDLHYPGKNLSTPLTMAINRSDPVILTMLIDKIPGNLDGTLTQPCGKTALMHAAYCAKNPEILYVLIRKGANPRKVDINGWNCLFYAVIGKQAQNFLALLNCKVPIESKDNEGRTPLIISVYLSNLDMFELLVKSGADFNALDNNGLSALHLAILRKNRECVIKLLKLKANKDQLTTFTNVSAQRLAEEIMAKVLPIRRNSYDDIVDDL